MANIQFNLVVTDNDNILCSKPLSYSAVESIVTNSADHSDNNDLFLAAARHAASTVREGVAYKDNISEDVVKELINDTSISVLRNLVRSSKFKEFATLEVLEKYINLDIEIAQSIASDVTIFTEVDQNKLIALVLAHSDPYVIAELAGSWNTPKKVLKTLVNHADPHVASEAKSRLED